MSFKSNNFYKISCVLCLVFAIAIKGIRIKYFGVNDTFDVLLGSAPSFLYLFGLISFVPIVKFQIEFSAFLRTAVGLTLGALAYEFEQYWSSRTFDLYDVIATILALVTVLVVHHRKWLSKEQVD